jgi:hypothetical protein
MSDVRPRAFAKRSDDADPGAVDPDAVKRLAYLWDNLAPAVQGYFEELYEAMPEKVSTVLTGTVLPRGGERTTLGSWTQSAKGEQGFVDTSDSTVSVIEVKVDPANPGSGVPFAVVWSVSAHTEKGFSARKDKVQVLKDGAPVAEKTIDQPPMAAGQHAEVRADFGAIPIGSYQVLVVANVEGGDGATMNEHGLQTQGTAMFAVGQTREAQMLEDVPRFSKASGLIQSAVTMNPTVVVREGDEAEGIPPILELDQQTLRQLADAADELASMDVMADGFKQALGSAAVWLRDNPRISEEDWTTLRGQLVGLSQIPPDDAGKFAMSFIEALEEQSPYPFVR